MDIHIDWLSFTQKAPRKIVSTSDLYYVSKALLKEISDEHERYVFDGQGIEAAWARRPYSLALQRDDAGILIMGGGHIQNVLFELAGRACEGIREPRSATAFISPVVESITRLDVACDVRTGTRPASFANSRSHQAFRTVQFNKSDTGETVYIGSTTSDRFVRVYRYDPPHPRSELLRIEFVFRRGLARDAARELVSTESFHSFAAKVGNSFGFNHEDWQPAVVTDEKMKTSQVNRQADRTTTWLYKQVAPAMARLLREDAIDVKDWWEHVCQHAGFEHPFAD